MNRLTKWTMGVSPEAPAQLPVAEQRGRLGTGVDTQGRSSKLE